MNAGLSVNIFLDVLVLLVSGRDEETVILIGQLIDTYKEEIRNNKSLDSALTKRFLNLLQELRKLPRGEEGDASRMSSIANFILNNKDIDAEDHLFFEAMQGIFDAAKKVSQSKELLDDKKKTIKQILTYTKFKRWTTRMYGKLNEFLSTSDLDQQSNYLADVTNYARKIVDALAGDLSAISNGAEERVVFSDRNSMREALELVLKAESGVSVLKTGLQGLNKMFGERGGLTLGEFVIIYGLSHHFKTGLLLSIARGIAKHNDPADIVKPGKKPLILFISLENYARSNLMWFFKTAYICIFNKKPAKDMTIDAIMDVVQEFYIKNGWEFIIERYKGSEFGYDELVSTVEKYEALNYQVVVTMLDYMEKMKKKSSIYSGETDSHQALAALTNGVFSFAKSKDMLFISPHQFNREMLKVADRVKTNVVKHFSADGVSGSLAVNQAADLEIYVYIENDLDKHAWLTVHRGKHRDVDNTKTIDKYFAYKFDPELGISDDIEGKKMFVRDIYGAGSESKQEQGQQKASASYDALSADVAF